MQLRKRPWQSLYSDGGPTEGGIEMRVAQVATKASRSSLSDVFRARKNGVRIPAAAKANIVTTSTTKVEAKISQTPRKAAAAAEAHPQPAALDPLAVPAMASPAKPRQGRVTHQAADAAVELQVVAAEPKPRRKRAIKAKATVATPEPDMLAAAAAQAETLPLPPLSLESIHAGCAYLSAADPRLAPLIKEHGPPEKLIVKDGHTFESLVCSIMSQQLATGAARTIYGRFQTACKYDDGMLKPEAVLSMPMEDLRSCGLSGAKAKCILDLASHYADGRLTCEALKGMTEAQLIEELTKVKVQGIGRWTADMFSMFSMGRPDVLPVGDLGVRKGFQFLYKLKALPDAAQMEELSHSWRPWRSIGSYYMWRVCEAEAASRKKKK